MKIFVSWSGDLSKKIAQELKTWIPCIIQSVEVFYSPEDIEKGENWDSKISAELSECNYGIVCLTSENTDAPWINFEAGAIAKTLDSRVSALMVNIKTSEIKGPLKRYQATKLEKDDMYQLIVDINKTLESPLAQNVLNATFNAIWEKMYEDIRKCIEDYIPNKLETKNDQEKNGEAIEEILQLVRKQNVMLNSPEQLLPPDYVEAVYRRHGSNTDVSTFINDMCRNIDIFLSDVYDRKSLLIENEQARRIFVEMHIIDFTEALINNMMERDTVSMRYRKRLSFMRSRCLDIQELINRSAIEM